MSSTISPQPTYTYASVYPVATPDTTVTSYSMGYHSVSRALMILIIVVIAVALCILVCITRYIYRRRINRRNVQVQLVQPEVEGSIGPAPLSGGLNPYSGNVNNNNPSSFPVYSTNQRAPNGEELVLVPRHILAQANSLILQEQQQQQNPFDNVRIFSMEAIREASGVHLGQTAGTGQLLTEQPYFDRGLQAQPLSQGSQQPVVPYSHQLTLTSEGTNTMSNVSIVQRQEGEVTKIQ